MIAIDGSLGEGGGQVLRTALALSVLTGQPIHMTHIRASRRKPGLAPQHLAGVRAAGLISGAEISGAVLRSTEIAFRPQSAARPGDYVFDVSELSGQGSAGAVTLLLQTILLPLALARDDTHLILRGGTHVAWSPPAEYVAGVLFPTLAQIGIQAALSLNRWGWYPRGGGELEVMIQGGASLRGLDLTSRGSLLNVSGIAAASNLPAHVPQRISARANNVLREAGLPGNIKPLRTSGPSTGTGIEIIISSENSNAGFGALGEKGKPSERVAEEAALPLIAYFRSQVALDPYLPDQVLPALMLAEGPSVLTTIEITRHTLTMIEVVQHFVERLVKVEGNENQPGTIRVEGTAPTNLC